MVGVVCCRLLGVGCCLLGVGVHVHVRVRSGVGVGCGSHQPTHTNNQKLTQG